jgi:tRNA(Ile)-lysidine synthase
LYYRNRIRKELVPDLTTFNPQIKERLISMADVVQFEDDYLSSEVTRAGADAIVEKNEGYIIFSLDATAKLHPAILRRLILSSIHQLNPGTRDISHENIARAAHFLKQDSPGDRIDLASNFEMVKYLKKYVILCDCNDTLDDLWPQIQHNIPLQNLGKEGINLNGKWKITLSDDNEIDRSDAWRCWLDADQVESLRLDRFGPGDKFIPCGMNGKSQKLGDYWTNEGLPVRARANWPLVRSGGEIAWVPGFRIGERYKITERTRRILSLQLKKVD